MIRSLKALILACLLVSYALTLSLSILKNVPPITKKPTINANSALAKPTVIPAAIPAPANPASKTQNQAKKGIFSKLRPQPCPAGKHYSIISKKCICDNYQKWNQKLSKCECQSKFEANAAGSCVKCSGSKANVCNICYYGLTFDPVTSVCGCPIKDTYYNTNNGKCQSCKSPDVWGEQSSTCWHLKQGIFTPGKGFFSARAAKCPASKPYLAANNVCQTCDTIWNTRTRSCCPAGSNIINMETFQCDIS